MKGTEGFRSTRYPGADPRQDPGPQRNGKLPPLRFLSSSDFLASWRPKDFLLKPIIEEGRFVTLTGPTGTGKTAIALLIALHIALGTPLGSCKVRKAGVIFMAGENPDDVRTRWLTMLRRLGIDPKTIDVRFVEGRFDVSEYFEIIAGHLLEKPVGVVIFDTLQSFFTGDDSNSNSQMMEAAQAFRAVARLGPAVLVPAHPVKGASKDRNIPYGGGALINESDGNLSVWGPPDAVELHWCQKFRGSFEPLTFALDTGMVPDETDSDGDPIRTVTARILAADEAEARERANDSDQRALMAALRDHPGASIQKLADLCAAGGMTGWSKSNTKRRLQALRRDGLAEVAAGIWTLTAKGKRAIPEEKEDH